MTKHIKTLMMILFFGLLLSPIRINAMQPVEPFPLGIVVEVDGCVESNTVGDKYIVDVVIQKAEIQNESPGFNTVPDYSPIFPDALVDSAFADYDNEWISLLLFSKYNEWHNSLCSSIMYYSLESIDFLEFTEFKVVVYEEGNEPVISKVYFTKNLATWEDTTGFKIIYHPSDQSFSLQGYEAEFNPGSYGTYDWIWVLVAIAIVIVVGIFGFMESAVYLIGRQGKRATLIPLGFNLMAFGFIVLQSMNLFFSNNDIMVILGLLLIPGVYAGKVLLLYKYETTCFKVSILFSAMFYAIYLYLAMVLLR